MLRKYWDIYLEFLEICSKLLTSTIAELRNIEIIDEEPRKIRLIDPQSPDSFYKFDGGDRSKSVNALDYIFGQTLPRKNRSEIREPGSGPEFQENV